MAGLYSCRKLKAVPPVKTPTTNPQTNPKTAATQCDYDVSDTAFTNHGWTKAFDDEFSTNLSNWYAFTGGVTKELECNEPANVLVAGGALQITAKKQTVTGPTVVNSTDTSTFSYTSGSIVSNATFAASAATPKLRIVARMKVAAGYGLTSIFESYGQNWPTNGQINFVQVEGYQLNLYTTNYFYGSQAGVDEVSDAQYFDPVDSDLSSCWHVFMTEWTQTSLSYYLDGKLVETKTGGYIPDLYGKAENLALDLPIGGLYYDSLNTANIQNGTMYVDYVKVFTSN